MARLLLVEDHELVRKGLKYLLESSDDPIEVGEASCGAQALRKIQSDGSWNAVVLDISLPGQNGVEVLKQIKKMRPSLPVLILTMHSADQYGVRVIRAGASGFLTKNSAPEKLHEAVHTILAGGRYVGPELTERLVGEVAAGVRRQNHNSLSDREYEVFCLIAAGQKPAEIAAALKVSAKTIQSHRSRILEKLDLKNTAELILFALKHNLVE